LRRVEAARGSCVAALTADDLSNPILASLLQLA
jgi:hypothetical protein